MSGPLGIVASGRTASASPSVNFIAAVTADAPIAWWRPTAATAATLADRAGAYTGTVVGSPTLSTDVFPGGERSLLLDAASKYVAFGDVLDLIGDNTVAFETWLKIPVNGWSGQSWSPIIAKGDGGSYRIAQNSSNASLLQVKFAGQADATLSLQTGTWKHLVVTGDAGNQKVYLDAALVSDVATALSLTGTADSLRLGSNDGAAGRSLWGRIADTMIYDTTLSASRVLAHYLAGMNAPWAITDTFTRANGALVVTETGHPWIATGGVTWAVTSNKMYRTSGFDPSAAYPVLVNTPATTMKVTQTPTDYSFTNVWLRANTNRDGYRVEWNGSNGTIYVGRMVAGAVTYLGNTAAGVLNTSLPVTARVTDPSVGTVRIEVIQGGSVVFTVDDTSVDRRTTGTYAGVSTPQTSIGVDNFTAEAA